MPSRLNTDQVWLLFQLDFRYILAHIASLASGAGCGLLLRTSRRSVVCLAVGNDHEPCTTMSQRESLLSFKHRLKSYLLQTLERDVKRMNENRLPTKVLYCSTEDKRTEADDQNMDRQYKWRSESKEYGHEGCSGGDWGHREVERDRTTSLSAKPDGPETTSLDQMGTVCL